MIFYITAYVYMALLASLTAVVLRGGKPAMTRTLLTLVGNYALVLLYTWTTKDPDPWPVFMLLDFIAALIVLIHPAGRAQAMIGLTYLAQIAIHTGYALNGTDADPVTYWWLVTSVAFLQLILVGGWWFHGSVLRLRLFRRHRPHIAAAHREGVEK